ncbi:MAG: DUF454 domain-containing protein [Anaerolineaceae bacterium]|nr:DUF454 domain-containing protein [Anaerolineaceae bacterium]NTV37213.1 DUF454 domain-containing protein [Anaerolineaceae bacterium]
MDRLYKSILIIIGTVFMLLGIIGIFLPILPTTPFLLLAAFFYARSSQRFYDWLLNNRWFGTYIRSYREGRGVSLQHKLLALSMLWITIGYATLFVSTLWWVKIILIGIAVGVTIHLIKIKTFKPAS